MEVSNQIIKVLDNLGQKFGIAVDWTQSNITPYIQQLGQRIVNYELCTSMLWIVIAIVLVSISYRIRKKREFKKIDWDNDGEFMTGAFVIILLMLGIVIGIVQILDIINCLILPERVWIDYIQCYIPK